MLQREMGNIDSQLQSANAAIVLSDEHHLRFWSSWARMLRGSALAETGEQKLGLAELQHGDEEMRSIGGSFLQPFVSLLQAARPCVIVRRPRHPADPQTARFHRPMVRGN